MKSLLFYLLGCLSPLAVIMLMLGWGDYMDWRARRRYQRAWDKFSAEFDTLDPQRLAELRCRWAEEPYRYAQICDDRSRYFNMRWQYGNTSEA